MQTRFVVRYCAEAGRLPGMLTSSIVPPLDTLFDQAALVVELDAATPVVFRIVAIARQVPRLGLVGENTVTGSQSWSFPCFPKTF